MEIIVFSALGLLLVALLGVWLSTCVRYCVTPTHLKVLLWGIPIRRLHLKKIESISKRRGPGLSEKWYNTVKPGHRRLVIRRQGGICRNFIITPRNRYIFRADLERAIDNLDSPERERVMVVTD